MYQTEIWDDLPVLQFLKTHEYTTDLTPLTKNRVYRRAKDFQMMAHNLYKVDKDGKQLLHVPPTIDRIDLVSKIHRDIGHFGVHLMLDRLRRN